MFRNLRLGCVGLVVLCTLMTTATDVVTGNGPISLHPVNPHYFLWRDRPTVLITSGEHYGSVLNLDSKFKHGGGAKALASPQFDVDIALRVLATHRE